MADLVAPHFQDEEKARQFLEAKRWPNGPVCPHCEAENNATKLEPKEGKKTHARKGVWKCKPCGQQFSVTVGTIMEDSHIPLNKWLYAFHLLCASKKGMSAHQLHRMLGVTYKSAWFMAHRIRWAMAQEPLSSKLTGTIEIDETYVGGKRRNRFPHATKPGEREQDRPAPFEGKEAVVSVLQRGGRVQSMHVEKVTAKTLKPVVRQMVDESAHVMTDSGTALKFTHKEYRHDMVNHSAGEYVRYEDGVMISTNSIEGFFGILKRGVNGVYHHVGKRHLHRYLSEFDFRYNTRKMTDVERRDLAIKQVEGKRLLYRESPGMSA
ncbi:MAG TPA: IS1595 family transposase [Bryobacteraceae bacterium]|nr:IS1595 family transposase [Bryobacteraceae bacterium]